jgi:hypothetical protein
MSNLARAYLAGKPFEAEPLLRACLAIQTKKAPDEWRTFETRSLLGASLLGQKKYAEAEPLLLQGYEGMKAREAKIPAPSKKNLAEAVARIIQLYDAWGKKDRARAWRNVPQPAPAGLWPEPTRPRRSHHPSTGRMPIQ